MSEHEKLAKTLISLWDEYSDDWDERYRTGLKEGEAVFSMDRFIFWLKKKYE